MKEILSSCLGEILLVLINVILSLIVLSVRNLYSKYINTATKINIVNTCVKAGEQLYKDIHGDEKKAEVFKDIANLLNTKGISISADEINALIEAAVHDLNSIK